jgi:hypothetical protein
MARLVMPRTCSALSVELQARRASCCDLSPEVKNATPRSLRALIPATVRSRLGRLSPTTRSRNLGVNQNSSIAQVDGVHL